MNTKRALEASNQLALRTNEAARDIENRWKIEEIGRLVDFEAAGEVAFLCLDMCSKDRVLKG